MNKVRFVFGAASVAALGLAVAAVQAQQHHEDPAAAAGMPMMGMGMGMMGGAMHQSVMAPFLLPELQSELGLSAQQVTQLRQMKQEMLTKGKDFSTQIAAKRKELDALLAPGTSKGEQVKKLFEQIANLRAQQMYTGYETATKMKAALTGEQRTKFAAMKPYEFHQAMMSRMTMNDMSQMMQFMGGDGMMMGQGMMHEGMMGAPPKQ
jgi:Spy/CpxP family protein refolding chaperone